MNDKRIILFTLLVAALSACGQSMVDVEAERAALRMAADAYHDAASKSDIERVAGLCADNCRILPPNAPALTGGAAFLDFASAFTGVPGFSMSFDTPTVAVSASGDMGFTLTDTHMGFDGPDGSRVDDRIRDFHLWEKQEGEWKVAVDIWNSELPLPESESLPPVDGAWVVTSLQSSGGESIEPAGASQFIFSSGHYSAIYTVGVSERQNSAVAFAPTDEEKLVQYDTLIVNSGTYEVDGNNLIMRPTIAKSPEFVGGTTVWEYSVDGDIMTGTIVELTAANGQAPEDAGGNVMTLRRVP